ncbi:myelin and lymphocyte protein-like [Polypterus senegalus]|uniref:myelin and lymphocyte protein-like n=1 Tax=Polypterus senegalus TaxID=55291 RepID=UPI001965AA22|nr:myelin and lymphocyte protein-like [Polypterus senegalus]
MLQGWVLFVSICCFIVSSVLLLVFCLGRKMKSFWRKLGLLYHCLASPLYAVALILQIIATCGENERINSSSNPNMESNFKLYLDTAALIFCLIKVFLHFIYCVTLVAGI